MSPKIQKLRQRIADLKDRIESLQSGGLPVPKDTAAARLDAWLGDAAEQGAHALAGWVGHFSHKHPENPGSMLIVGDPAAYEKLLAALHGDVLHTRLHSLLDAHYQGIGDTVSPESVPKLITELAAELLQIERDDHRESLAAGVPARADTDPRILLGV